MYLLLVRYGSEAERKRLEYLIERWGDALRFERPSGTALIVEGSVDKVFRFIEELYSRIPREEVRLYKLVEPDIHLAPLTLEAVVKTSLSVEEVWGAISLAAAKLKAALISEAGNTRTYQVSVKGGSCRVRFTVKPSGTGSVIELTVEGFGSAIPSAFNKLLRELSPVGEVVRYE